MMQRLLAFLTIAFAVTTSQAAPIPTFEVESGTLCLNRNGQLSALDVFQRRIESTPDYVAVFVEYQKTANSAGQIEVKQMVVVKKPVSIQDFTTSGNSTTGPDTVCAKIVHVK